MVIPGTEDMVDAYHDYWHHIKYAREFVIVTGYRQQQIMNFLEAHYPALEVTFIYNEKYASTNNIYSLWLTRPYVDKGPNKPQLLHAVLRLSASVPVHFQVQVP